MNKLMKKLSKQKTQELRKELVRAHLIISLLSFVSIVLFLFSSTLPDAVNLDFSLSIIASVLLLFLIVTSTLTAYTLSNIKK